MLRASADVLGHRVDLAAVTSSGPDRTDGSPATGAEPGVPAAAALVAFVDALVGPGAGPLALDAARTSLVEAVGAEAAARAALVTGNFEMMNRILDATGVPVPPRLAAMAEPLGLPPFPGRR